MVAVAVSAPPAFGVAARAAADPSAPPGVAMVAVAVPAQAAAPVAGAVALQVLAQHSPLAAAVFAAFRSLSKIPNRLASYFRSLYKMPFKSIPFEILQVGGNRRL